MSNGENGGKVTTWHGGQPCIEYIEPVTPQKISDLMLRAANLTFSPRSPELHPEDAEFVGQTNMQVAATRAWRESSYGDLEQFRHCLDRTVGKPKQQVEQITINMDFQQFAVNVQQDEAFFQRFGKMPITDKEKQLAITMDAEVVPIQDVIPVSVPEQNAERLLEGL